MTNYVQNTDYSTSGTAGVILGNMNGFVVTSSGAPRANTYTYSDYSNVAQNYYFISKGTLENVITGKDLISSSALTNYVQNTDYATASIAGVLKIDTDRAFDVNSSGKVYAKSKTYSEYTSADNYTFISKGTLENVITGKHLVATSDIEITPVQQSGATVGTIQIGNGNAITLYAPQPGAVSTELAGAQQTYYLTGVKETVATEGSQIYNTRMSNTYTGLKYQTSTSNAGGSLYVDNREVTLGLYYEIA